MKDKNVLLPGRFLEAVAELVGTARRDALTDRELGLVLYLEGVVEAKAGARRRRELFAAYKAAPPGDGRDAARLGYLAEAGVPRAFRSASEAPGAGPP